MGIRSATVTPALLTLVFDDGRSFTLTKAQMVTRLVTDGGSLALAAPKVITAIQFTAAGAVLTDHGTPNTYSLNNLNIVCAPDRNTQAIYGLLIDGTGFTPTSTSDIQVRIRGLGC